MICSKIQINILINYLDNPCCVKQVVGLHSDSYDVQHQQDLSDPPYHGDSTGSPLLQKNYDVDKWRMNEADRNSMLRIDIANDLKVQLVCCKFLVVVVVVGCLKDD